jgi:DNA-binding LytR/AlgR family response regulator
VIVLENDRLETRISLKKVEEEIDMNSFLRCHKSFIINKERITRQHGNSLTLLGSSESIPIGEKYRNNVLTEISALLRRRMG